MSFLWIPTLAGIQSANVTLPMVLGVALIWRYRDRAVVVAIVAGGFVVALKLFFWPLLIWLVATRRYRSAALGALASSLFVFVPWAGIGFAGLRGYPSICSGRLAQGGCRQLLAGRARALRRSELAGRDRVETIVGVGVLLLAFAVGRRGRDRDAFALATSACSPSRRCSRSTTSCCYSSSSRSTGVASARPGGAVVHVGSSQPNNGSGLQRVHVLVVVAATVVSR